MQWSLSIKKSHFVRMLALASAGLADWYAAIHSGIFQSGVSVREKAAAAFLIKTLEEVKKDTHSATIHHWTRRFWKVSTGGTWWKVKGSAQKCQGSPSVIVQSFFTPVLWIDCGCFQSIPHRRLWKNIDTWTFYNLWRKKVEICWPLLPEPRAIELLTEPQCLLKPAHCECKMTFTDTSPFSVCCSAAAAAAASRGSMCVWGGGLSGLRSQVSGRLLQDCPLRRDTDGHRWWDEVWDSDTDTLLTCFRLCLLLQRPNPLQSHRASLRSTCPRPKPAANSPGRRELISGSSRVWL